MGSGTVVGILKICEVKLKARYVTYRVPARFAQNSSAGFGEKKGLLLLPLRYSS
jgi:hypothetical protein